MMKCNVFVCFYLLAIGLFSNHALKGMLGEFPYEFYDKILPNNYYKILSVSYKPTTKEIEDAYQEKKLAAGTGDTSKIDKAYKGLKNGIKKLDNKGVPQTIKYDDTLVDQLYLKLGLIAGGEPDTSNEIQLMIKFLNEHTEHLKKNPDDTYVLIMTKQSHKFSKNDPDISTTIGKFISEIVSALLKPKNQTLYPFLMNDLLKAFIAYQNMVDVNKLTFVVDAINNGFGTQVRLDALLLMIEISHRLPLKLESLKKSLSVLRAKLTQLSDSLKGLKAKLSQS